MQERNIKEQILDVIENHPITYTTKELAQVLDIKDGAKFDRALNALITEGSVILTSKKKVVFPSELGFYVGKLEIKRKGFGFVLHDDGDIFISKDDLEGAFDGETVMVKLKSKKSKSKSKEGYVEKILSTSMPEIIGAFEKSQSFSFVLPDDSKTDDIYVSKSKTMQAKDGQKVIVKITKRATNKRSAEGRIIEILGFPGQKGVDVLSVIRRYGIETEFSEKALNQALESANREIDKVDLLDRRDLRDENIFTIDGADAKDLDDAVSIELFDNGNMLLGVHIADVTNYVKKGSALDVQAADRGTSVYLVDKVVPMLPPCLSNGMCSLNEKVDRLTLSCDMEFDTKGNVIKYDIYKSVINSVHRMTYSDVNEMLENEDAKIIRKYKDIYKDLLAMQHLSSILRKKREDKGSIDFDIDEAHIKTDENGKVIEIVPRERGTAEKLIEDFMLAANKTVAEHYHWRDLPFVYRVHEDPNVDKLKELTIFLTNFGVRLKGIHSGVRPKQLQQVLDMVRGEKHEKIVSQVVLRSLQKAEYYQENLGHFGLAFDYYCHFTSPIRRYPDFTIHRIIKDDIDGKIDENKLDGLKEEVQSISKHSSLMERRAMEAERSVEDIKKCEFIKDKIGETFNGIVSGVTRSALFVELDNTIEGVLPLSSMIDDYYELVENMYCVIGERTRRKISLGDEIEVVLKDVNVMQTRIEFGVNSE